MKTRFLFLMVTTLLVVSLLSFSTSCKKIVLNGEEDARYKLEKTAYASQSGNSNLSVNWDNWTHGDNYTVPMARADFGHISQFTQVEQARTMISQGRLRVRLLENETGSSGGVITYSNINSHSGYEMTYTMRFGTVFDFESAGYFGFGLGIGDGLLAAPSGKGAGFRLRWAKAPNGEVYIHPYLNYADQSGPEDNDFGVRYPTTGSIQKNTLYTIKMVFKANTKMNKNGRAELYINGVQVLNVPVRWTKDHDKRKANRLLFENYRVGSASSASQQYMWFDDFSLSYVHASYTPTWCDSVYTVSRHYDAISQTYYHLTEIKQKDNNGDVIRLMHGHAAKTEGETGTEFARRMDCCVAFNASMGRDDQPPGVRKPVGIQIIDGTILQDSSVRTYTLGIKDQNELKAYERWTTAQHVLNDGANDALTAFVPWILDHQPAPDSVIMAHGNSDDPHPRQVIAQYDNGNILVLSCGGRGYDGNGMTAYDVIRILSPLNVRFAFNLDGGGSVTTMLNGERITPLIDGDGTLERLRPNFLYIPYNHD